MVRKAMVMGKTMMTENNLSDKDKKIFLNIFNIVFLQNMPTFSLKGRSPYYVLINRKIKSKLTNI